MSDNLINSNLQNQNFDNAFTHWIDSFPAVYVLTEGNMDDNSFQSIGKIRKRTGEGIKVKKITSDMIKGNLPLAQEIHLLALNGNLGFGLHNGRIQFRNDVVEKFGSSRVFKVTDGEHSEVTGDIDSLDEESYTTVAKIELIKPLIPLETGEVNQKIEMPLRSENVRSNQISQKTTFQKQMDLLMQQVVIRTIQLLRILEKKRHKKAEKIKEEEKQRVRERIKNDLLQRDIKNNEILNTEIQDYEINSRFRPKVVEDNHNKITDKKEQ